MAGGVKQYKTLNDSKNPPTTPQSKSPSLNAKSSLICTNMHLTKTKVLKSSSFDSVKSAKMFVNVNKIFKDGTSANNEYSSYTIFHPTILQQNKAHRSSIDEGYKEDGVSSNSDYNDYLYSRQSRLSGGTRHNLRHAANKLILSPSQCRLQPAGLKFFDPKTQVNVVNLQLNDVRTKENANGLMLSKQRSNIKKSKTRATQTLFRESSAQTLPFLPGVKNDPAELETLEIFKLPTILPGNGPAGLYEVEVLERARRRWNFAEALKENFRKQMETAKEQAKLQKHEHILEAFEWEHWIEREENIQECQMLRLEILIRMFDKRERDMATASKARVEKTYADIETKRNIALKKNETEFKRAMRRLDIKHNKQSRVWRKEPITKELGDPTSEFYAPKMRYGANPNRRHFTALHSGFDMRMDNLEKKAIQMDPKNLKCPFAKLRQWSKPKEILQEVEQNFCSDANLNRLYDSLRILRETSRKHKYTPLCLKTKKPVNSQYLEESKEMQQTQSPANTAIDNNLSDILNLSTSEDKAQTHSEQKFELGQSFEELRKQKQAERLNLEKLQKEMRCEELETLINSYQGNTIGWLMRFLTEEMSRLKEERKLQFLSMLAKRKRWRREAAEAGFRQKENCVRETYEKMYRECSEVNKEITQTFVASILETEAKDYAHQKADENIVMLAKDLDKEISGWLESFGEIQNPLNYQTLRQALKDIVLPDEQKLVYRLERDKCINYIINDVLMEKVFNDLEPYDISLSLTNDLVDRLIDNDLFLVSPDCSSDCDCTFPYTCTRAQQEARAIIRKVIRRAVPGRRWLTEEERITRENINYLLEDVFCKAITDDGIIERELKSKPLMSCGRARTDLIRRDDHNPLPLPKDYQNAVKFKHLNPDIVISKTDITKSLQWNEKLLLTDPDKLPNDDYVITKDEYVSPKPKPKLSVVCNIPSYHNLPMIKAFRTTPIFAQTSSDELLEKMQLEADEEVREEVSQLNEGNTEEFGQTEEEVQEEHYKYENNYEIGKENYTVQEVGPETFLVATKSDKKVSVKETPQVSTFQTSSEAHTIQIVSKQVAESEQAVDEEDDDSSSLMKVSFTYDPQLHFSVAIPTDDDYYDTEH